MDQQLERMASEFGGRVRDKVSQSHQFDVSQASSVRHLAQPIVDFIDKLCREASRAEGISLSVVESLILTSKNSRNPALVVKVSDNTRAGAEHTYRFEFEGDSTLFGEDRFHHRANYKALYEVIVQRVEDKITVAPKPQSVRPDA